MSTRRSAPCAFANNHPDYNFAKFLRLATYTGTNISKNIIEFRNSLQLGFYNYYFLDIRIAFRARIICASWLWTNIRRFGKPVV